METKKRPQYMDKFQLLNKSEQILYERLCKATPKLIVFSQVSMSQIFHIQSYRKNGFIQLGEIGRKSVDFLLCRKDTSIILAIELNGPTHDAEAQKIGDEKKRAALEEAGIPLVIFKPDEMPESEQLTKILAPYVVDRHKSEAIKREEIELKKAPAQSTNCELCQSQASPEEITWCKSHKKKFKGKVLCRKCQKAFTSNGNQ